MIVETKNFKNNELACPCCGENRVNKISLERLQRVRDRYGNRIHINSAYRCKQHNEAVGGHKKSAHLQGNAFDIACHHEDAFAILALCIAEGFTRIGVKQTGDPAKRFIHVDDLRNTDFPVTVWSY